MTAGCRCKMNETQPKTTRCAQNKNSSQGMRKPCQGQQSSPESSASNGQEMPTHIPTTQIEHCASHHTGSSCLQQQQPDVQTPAGQWHSRVCQETPMWCTAHVCQLVSVQYGWKIKHKHNERSYNIHKMEKKEERQCTRCSQSSTRAGFSHKKRSITHRYTPSLSLTPSLTYIYTHAYWNREQRTFVRSGLVASDDW